MTKYCFKSCHLHTQKRQKTQKSLALFIFYVGIPFGYPLQVIITLERTPKVIY